MKFKNDAKLVLENGMEFYGNFIGAKKNKKLGEVIFNTGVCGYQEVISDPSYKNQIVVFTFPLVGSYGTDDFSNESLLTSVSGIVVSNFEEFYSNGSSSRSLQQYLVDNDICGITGINTRELTVYIRDNGSKKGIICEIDTKFDDIKDLFEEEILTDLVHEVSTKQPVVNVLDKNNIFKTIVLYDFGLKGNILNELVKRNFRVVLVNSRTPFEEVLRYNPDAIFLSNGPGDPRELESVTQNVKKMVDAEMPIFGICLGCQLLGAAFDLDIEKLKFGHHGINHPVKQGEKVLITSQNHNYAIVNNEKLNDANVDITHFSLNDKSVEGIKHKSKKIYAVQYHPEACPGPSDAQVFFDEIVEMMEDK